ncbi:LptF/LptG family permease [Flexithrix dorotheae]|uniref:LptF/LptG family permease n=1 Tax=Flexithrix dorotheae TaxID=70993 RepID=UPI00037F40CD|nr:LptF/LptG family permease [Flexithrix dorotheae]
MKILDRYIIKKFFVTYFFVVAILMAVIVVVDYTEKSDDFIKHNLSLGFILKEYYLVYIPTMANTLSPLAVFISVVFFTSKLASHTEIVAILSAGVSFRRFLMPYLFGATVLGIYTFFMVGWIIPKAAKKQIQFSVEYLKSPYYFELRDVHFKTGDSTYIYIQNYNNRVKTGYKFTLEKVGGVELLEKLSADKVVWDTVKQTWHIDKYKVHTFEGDKERAWAGNNMDTMLNISPKYFENDYKLEETMTLKELENYIREEVERGVGNVERFLNTKYERYAYPFAIIILTIMGVTISAKKSRRGTGFQIALGFFLAFVYLLFVIMSRSLATGAPNETVIAFIAWLPNITFAFITSFLYFMVPK